MSGKLIIISAPSGAGKTTIIKHLLQHPEFKFEFSISACSRTKRETEIDGKDYYFLSSEDFKNKISNNEFIEWEEVYKDHFYGTLKSEIDRIFLKGNNVLFDVDVKGGVSLKQIFGTKSLSIFIMPPSIVELEKRLRLRHTDSEENILKRVEKAKDELLFFKKFDNVVVNDKLENAIKETEKIIFDFLK
ncbi:MAG: guanylate kinase [Bacteroidetes bacterium GWA2_30_7]|nr:MAG: guanylate kinase [Bacteroidetes bacterium GWA2_30_7]